MTELAWKGEEVWEAVRGLGAVVAVGDGVTVLSRLWSFFGRHGGFRCLFLLKRKIGMRGERKGRVVRFLETLCVEEPVDLGRMDDVRQVSEHTLIFYNYIQYSDCTHSVQCY